MATVLAVGGTGDVGSLIVPRLRRRHRVRIMDVRAPAERDEEYVRGDLTDPRHLADAMSGVDTLLFMAMGSKDFDAVESAIGAFDVSVKGLYLSLRAAYEHGVTHAVYTSSVSVFEDWSHRYIGDEDAAMPDADHFYGLSKRLGEEVCRSATRIWGMSVNALRLCLPVSDSELRRLAQTGVHSCHVGADDLASAVLAAIEYRNGFQTFNITGDAAQHMSDLRKADRLLGWRPTSPQDLLEQA